MNGILCMNKPEGFTSFDVIAKLRGILRMRRLGHGGTLDPMATGVLPVFVGGATRACDILPCQDKSYLARFALGCETDTQDSTGTVTARYDCRVTASQLLEVLPRFTGQISQLPPMYSAVSVDGQRLYALARQGVEVERKPRAITIHELELRSFDEAAQTGTLFISCSKGTYIRTIIHDMGKALGCGGVMTGLERQSACGLTLADCVTFPQVEAARDAGALSALLLPIDRVFAAYPALHLNPAQSRMYRHGVKLSLDRLSIPAQSEKYRVYGADGCFFGIGRREGELFRVDKNLTAAGEDAS